MKLYEVNLDLKFLSVTAVVTQIKILLFNAVNILHFFYDADSAIDNFNHNFPKYKNIEYNKIKLDLAMSRR